MYIITSSSAETIN